MKYVGILRQQSSNNFKSILLLIMFPVLLLGLTWVFCAFLFPNTSGYSPEGFYVMASGEAFASYAPIVAGATLIWFLVAFSMHSWMISSATHSKPLERRENKRVYNLVENLCMAHGMAMPKVNVIEEQSLNAFASGINKKS
ncbi:MAG: protease, partial [Bacteroidales bacterium]|nr:protease [Bacteroidales bacterium]